MLLEIGTLGWVISSVILATIGGQTCFGFRPELNSNVYSRFIHLISGDHSKYQVNSFSHSRGSVETLYVFERNLLTTVGPWSPSSLYIWNQAPSCQIRRPGSACTVILILCRIQKMSAKTPPKIQNPKSKIQNPKSKIWNPKFAQKGLLHKAPKSKIRNPNSKIPWKIQNLGRWPHVKKCYITIQNPAEKVWILDWGILDFGFRILDFGGVQGMYH